MGEPQLLDRCASVRRFIPQSPSHSRLVRTPKLFNQSLAAVAGAAGGVADAVLAVELVGVDGLDADAEAAEATAA